MRLIRRTWIVVACALLLVACGSENAPDPAGEPTSSPVSGEAQATPPATPDTAMEVGPIVWAQELDAETGEPTDVVTRFTTQSPAIIAVIEVSNMPAGTEFTATWTINGLPIDGTDMDISISEELDHAWIVFRFTRDEAQRYPIGQLNVTITNSHGDLREGSVEIGFP